MADDLTKTVAQRFKNINSLFGDIYEYTVPNFDVFLSEVDFLESCIKNGQISIGKTKRASDKENINTVNNETNTVDEDGQKKRKGRGRPRTTNILHEKRTDSSSTARSESPGAGSLNDSQASSTSSTRSKRAAAQAVGEKMDRMKSLLGNKKLRRPTDFDDFKKPQPADVSSPPTKSRKTRSKQSAGSNPDEAESKGATSGEELPKENCSVLVKRISTPEVKKLVYKRKSEDIFNASTPTLDPSEKPGNENANVTHTVDKEPQKKRQRGKKDKDSELSSSENEMRNSPMQLSPIINHSISAALGKAIAHSSPLTDSPSGPEFRGFDVEPVNDKPTRSKRGKQQETGESDKADVIAEKSIHIDQRVTRKTVNNELAGSDVEVVETETNIRSRTKVLRKTNVPVKDNQQNTTYTCEAKEDEASVRARTRVIKKETDQVTDVQDSEIPRSRTRVIKKEPDEDGSSEESRSRTRVIKKGKDQGTAEVFEVSDDSPVVEIKPKPRTRLSQTSSQSSEDEGKVKLKLKNKKKAEQEVPPEIVNPHQKKLAEEPPVRSPASVKGELVRKRVEDFEKKGSGTDQEGVPQTGTRLTRQAAKIKASTEPKGKTPSSLPRPVPISNSSALVTKPCVEDTEERMKEERRLKRQVKEEEATLKKEKYLKASAEETKRKREEKNQKAAAAREAAEREKALLAAKAEKEKEEKLRQIQLEKEKLKKEEIQKKKLLLQQKTKEHEERRKQEEAARLARLKEQEEEHKRALAMKEREMEQQRLQKAAEQRLAEAEKAKQAAKLGKIAAMNNTKVKAQTVSTPTQSSAAHNPDSYEITPARDEKPLLKPKTEDDYGIEDANSSDSSEDEDNPRKQIPAWAQAQRRRVVLKKQRFLPDSLRDAFFETNKQMPDAADIFKGFQIKKRIRTSSAVWRTPPLSARN